MTKDEAIQSLQDNVLVSIFIIRKLIEKVKAYKLQEGDIGWVLEAETKTQAAEKAAYELLRKTADPT